MIKLTSLSPFGIHHELHVTLINNKNKRMKSEILSDRELRLFSKQIQLPSVGIRGQEKLKEARVLVIGAGGKGSSLLQNLVSAGIGNLGISDNFGIEEVLIPKQSLYGDLDIGKQKAIVAKQKLSQLNHEVNLVLHNICLSEDNILDIFKDYNLVVDATDNFAAHYLINDAAIISKKTVIFGSVFHKQGLITVFNHHNGPSFRCLFPKIPHNTVNPADDGIYGLTILHHITGTIMANEVLSAVLGNHVLLNGKLLIFDISNYSITTEKIERNPENFTITSFG